MESFSLWLKFQKMGAKSQGSKEKMLIAQGHDLAPIFGDLSQNEKQSEIKPPLCRYCLAMISNNLGKS